MNREPIPLPPVLLIGLCAVLLPASVAVVFDHPPAHAQSRPPTKLYSQGLTSETANTDILASDLEIDREGALRIAVVCATSGVFSIFVDSDEVILNSGNALAAGCGYTFTWPVSPEEAINFQTDTSGNVKLKVQASWSDGL